MFKVKTKKAAAKRFKIKASGKIKRNKANKRHKLTVKTRSRKNNLKKATYVLKCDAGLVKACLPNG